MSAIEFTYHQQIGSNAWSHRQLWLNITCHKTSTHEYERFLECCRVNKPDRETGVGRDVNVIDNVNSLCSILFNTANITD